jgi:hypothetical protein
MNEGRMNGGDISEALALDAELRALEEQAA